MAYQHFEPGLSLAKSEKLSFGLDEEKMNLEFHARSEKNGFA